MDRWNEGADIEGSDDNARARLVTKPVLRHGNFRSTLDPQLSEFGVVFKDLGGLHKFVSP